MQACAAQHRGEQHQIGQASGLMIRMQRNHRRPRLKHDALGGMGQQACGIGQHGQCHHHLRRHLRRDDLTHPGAGHLGQRVGNKLDPQQMEALQKGEGVDLPALIHSVKHDALWIIAAVAVVCVLYFVGMRLTEKNSQAAD